MSTPIDKLRDAAAREAEIRRTVREAAEQAAKKREAQQPLPEHREETSSA